MQHLGGGGVAQRAGEEVAGDVADAFTDANLRLAYDLARQYADDPPGGPWVVITVTEVTGWAATVRP